MTGVRLAAVLAVAGALQIAAASTPESASPGADPAAAEPHFRVAQRLAADGDPSAAAAFERVLADAPSGPWAAPALLSLAKLAAIPDWPEDLGRLTAGQRAKAATLLDRAVALHPQEPLAQEAEYRAALLRLAPLPDRDPARARRALIAVAGAPRTEWSSRARYALGRLDEASGVFDRAAGAYARLLVEDPDAEASARARAGFARLLSRAGRFGDALATLGEGEVGGDAQNASAHALAARGLERVASPGGRWSALAPKSTRASLPRGASLLVVLPDGGVCLWDRKTGAVSFLGRDGGVRASVPLAGVTALAVDPYGRVFAAVHDRVVVVDTHGSVPACALAPLTTAGAIAVDAAGVLWAVDRRGERIARCAPGGSMQVVRESRGAEIAALAVSGGTLIAADAKSGRIIAISQDGSEASLGGTLRRPELLAVDAAGQIAVLEGKGGVVALLGPDGGPRDSLPLEAIGVERPAAIGFSADGALRLLDASTGVLVTVP